MSQNSKPNQESWEEMADKDQGKTVAGDQGAPKQRKPLKLGGQKFDPNKNSTSTLSTFLAPGADPAQAGFQQGVQQLFQQGFQPGFQQGFQPGPQPGFPGGFAGNQPVYQPGFQPQQGSGNNIQAPQGTGQAQPSNKPATPATNNTQTQQPPSQTKTTVPATQTKQTENVAVGAKKEQPKQPEKKEAKKPEPVKPEPKQDTKKGSKVDKKTGSDAQGKKEEKKTNEPVATERSYLKLQNLLAAQKNLKPEKVDIEAALKDSTKFDEIVDETRQPLNIVFIGHVDAGKSTTCGNILILTGQVDQNDVRKLKQEAKEKNRESWWIAYLMDIGEEEKTKGKTVEVGKAKFNTAHKRLTILDAPGHKNYVPNMIAGASQADVAALVISAKTGEFESGFEKGGQTSEHAMLAKSLGVRDLIVIINKMDEAGINWSQARYEHIKKQLLPFLKDSCGYDVEKNVYWLPMSAQTGENMLEGIKDARGSWYQGPTLFEILDNLPVPERDPLGPVRIPILDKFKDGSAIYVFGKVENGTIVYGSKLTLIPSGEAVTVHAIINNDDKRLPYAKPGETVKLHLKGIEDDYISRGDILCSNYSFAHVCTEIECEVTILDLPEHKSIMSTGYTCVIHLHAAVEEIYIKEIKAEYSKAEEKFKSAKYLKSGSIGIVRIASKENHPICCEKFETMPHLGRFTLRDEGKTISMGKILRVKPIYKE